MFDKIKTAFSNASKSLGERELKEKNIEEVLFELEVALLESDVATEVIDSIKDDLKSKLIGTRVEKKSIEMFVRDSLVRIISDLFDDAGAIDLFSVIDDFKDRNEPCIILFVGINGTGKTTSLAKVARLLQKSKYSVVIAAADTFRAGAIEQLREHTKRLNLKIVAQNYGSDPAAVARDAVLYARSHGVDCVLVDTAGRMQTSKNLMEQIEKIIKVVKPSLKIFVGDSLAGNDTVNQAREFHEYTKFDGAILTKGDADARGGAALSIVKITLAPVMFIGTGQEYDDLKPFDKKLFLSTVFGSIDGVDLTRDAEIKGTEPKAMEPEIAQPESVKTDNMEPKVMEPEITGFKAAKTQSMESSNVKPEGKSDDPFEGIGDEDIATYARLHDVPSPESDKDARKMAVEIREWIKNGRPDSEGEYHDDEEKPKKKHGLLGLFKK